ncbi:tRNA (uridine(54)-C5)-methyltransferase TrmA, partial [Vibrio diabolicus]
MATLDVNTQRYQEQLAEKVERLTDMFAPYNMPELEVFESPEQLYRMRAEFRVWHEGEDLYYIMF